jgi:hypothetical protein
MKSVVSARSGSKQEPDEPLFDRPAGEVRTMERRAIERWENEGGEIPDVWPQKIGTIHEDPQIIGICIY